MPCVSLLLQPKAQKGKPAEKVVHPYSRKAAYLAREEIRLKKKERSEEKKTEIARHGGDIRVIKVFFNVTFNWC